MRLDEVLALIPETGLSVRRLDQWPIWEGGHGEWTCVLENGGGCDNLATGATALEAVAASLKLAGFNLEDDGT